jgi:dimethylamine/trimethylamine dehydrogenase
VLATGSRWLSDSYSPNEHPAATLTGQGIMTPDDVAADAPIEGPVVVFDFDNYYMGGAISEHLARRGLAVSYVTPAGFVSAWTINTNELPLIHASLARHGIAVKTLNLVSDHGDGAVTLRHLFTGERTRLECRTLVVVGHRAPRNALQAELAARADDVAAAGIASIAVTGDALAPGAIAHAVYNGHRTARELGLRPEQRILRREA